MSDSNEAKKKQKLLEAERSRLYRERYRKEIAEKMRLYRKRHRERINQRRKEIKQQQLLKIFIPSHADNAAEMGDNLQETSIYEHNLKAHSRRQHRYYESHKNEINKRRREKRQQEIARQKIPATAAERSRSYREKHKQHINERRRNSRRLKQNSLTKCNNEVAAIELASCLNGEVTQEIAQSLTTTLQQHNRAQSEEIQIDRALTTMEALQKTEETLQDNKMTKVSEMEHGQSDSPEQSNPIPNTKPQGSQPTKETREELLKIEQRRLQILEAEAARSAALMKSDNYKFLMSLLPEMEKLPLVHKMRLRMKISQAMLDEVSSLEQKKINSIKLIYEPDLSVDIKDEPINMYLPK